MDFFNIPSELSKANSPAYKSGLLRLYRSGGCKDCNAKIGVGMYQRGGLGASGIMPNPQQFRQTFLQNQQALTQDQRMRQAISGDINRRSNTTESTRTTQQQFTPEQRANAATNSERAQRERRLADAAAANEESLLASHNWQQLLARQTQAIGDKLDVPFLPNWIDPFYAIGSMASGLGAAPYNIQQGNYGSAAWDIAAPIVTGGLASIGAKTTGQFLNNAVNPFASQFGRRVDAGDIQIVRQTPEFTTWEDFIPHAENIASGADDFKNVIAKRVNDLDTPEGRKRLIEQEKRYLQSIGFEGNIDSQAKRNAFARYEELSTIGVDNAKVKEYLANPNQVSMDDWSEFVKNERLRNNAYYTRPSDVVFDQYVAPSAPVTGSILTKYPQLGGNPVYGGNLGLGAPYLKNVPVMHHEIGHALQRGRQLPIDKDLIQGIRPKSSLTKIESDAYKYFSRGSEGKEASAFANELRSSMLERGLIKDIYDPITPEILENAYKSFRKKPMGSFIENDGSSGYFLSSHRIFDFMEPDKQNFTFLAEQLNKLPSTIPVGVGLGAAGVAGAQTGEYAKGGLIKRADGSYSRRGLWDNIRANRGSGKKPTKEMLKQERKIKAKYQEGGMSSEVPNSGTTIVYRKDDPRLIDYNWHSNSYMSAVDFPSLSKNLNAKNIKYSDNLMSDPNYHELKVCEDCGWDEETVNMWKNNYSGIKGHYYANGTVYYVYDRPEGNVEYREPPKIKNVWGEQIYTPNTNVSNIDAKRKAGTLEDYRYVVETEDGGLVELSNQEQYKKYKKKYGFDGNSLNVKYGRMPQFTTQPVVTTFERGGVIKDDRGQWAHPGKVTQINSPNITMKGVPYPVLGISDAGDTQMMMPNGEYQFAGNKVTEYPLFGKGGYTVRKTNERKGKTHVVIGPGGKKKYFGDPSMGERSKSKYGKEAFYKRHAKNLKSNPYFRAYARATWSDGGIVRDIEPFNLSSY
jgi:hypothetical protein